MVAVPAAMPVTMPAASMVATDAFELDHTASTEVALSALVKPWHMLAVPPMADGVALTVTTKVLVVAPSTLVMTTVPAATPVTMPEAEPTVATAGLPLLHMPPDIPGI